MTDDDMVQIVAQEVIRRATVRRERLAARITAAAFVVLLLSTCAAAGIAVHYRAEAKQLQFQGCAPHAAPLAVPAPALNRRIKA